MNLVQELVVIGGSSPDMGTVFYMGPDKALVLYSVRSWAEEKYLRMQKRLVS
jgi:hypothetical protein